MENTAHRLPGLRFLKMHGLGNDFVIVDARGADDPITPDIARAISDRRRGVGFDQLAVIFEDTGADARLVFWNRDGTTAGACGNATRCIAALLMAESGKDRLALRTEYGVLACEDAGDGLVRVNMGVPGLDWSDIPLAEEADTVELPLPGGPGAVSMGNPHCVFIVADAGAADIAGTGEAYENHPLFPQRTNVEMAQVLTRDRLRLRIWERGVGITLASGSCACAAVVAAVRKGLTDRRVDVQVDGGMLEINWRDDGVWMTGPTAKVFEGRLAPEFLGLAG